MDDPQQAVTHILDALGRGDPRAAKDLLPLVYEELRALASRRIAGQAAGQTLQATALVHEAYLRLVAGGDERSWNDRGHFFSAAAEAMRCILIDRARDRKRLKRGGGRKREWLQLNDVLSDDVAPEELIALDEALAGLAERKPRAAELAKLRIFAGLGMAEASESLGLPLRTGERLWAFARAWLFEALDPSRSEADPSPPS